VVLTQTTVGSEQSDQADVLTYRDDKLVKFPISRRHSAAGAYFRLKVGLPPAVKITFVCSSDSSIVGIRRNHYGRYAA
jgi:hypothetical protein